MLVPIISVQQLKEAAIKQFEPPGDINLFYWNTDNNKFEPLVSVSKRTKAFKLKIVDSGSTKREWIFDRPFMIQRGWQNLPAEDGQEPTKALKIYDSRLEEESQYVYTKSTRELKKVYTIFNQLLSGRAFKIVNIYAVHNEAMVKNFEQCYNIQHHELTVIKENPKHRSQRWKTTDKGSAKRNTVSEYLQKRIAKCKLADPKISILPCVFGGSNIDVWNLCNLGGATSLKNKDGNFGDGVYFSSSVPYMVQRYCSPDDAGEMTLALCYVIPGQAYPATENPLNKKISLKGKPQMEGCTAHYATVNQYGEPVQPKSGLCFDELVIFNEYQILPRYVVSVTESRKDPSAKKAPQIRTVSSKRSLGAPKRGKHSKRIKSFGQKRSNTNIGTYANDNAIYNNPNLLSTSKSEGYLKPSRPPNRPPPLVGSTSAPFLHPYANGKSIGRQRNTIGAPAPPNAALFPKRKRPPPVPPKEPKEPDVFTMKVTKMYDGGLLSTSSKRDRRKSWLNVKEEENL